MNKPISSQAGMRLQALLCHLGQHPSNVVDGMMPNGRRPDETTVPAWSRKAGKPTMSIIAWLVLGLIAGFIGSKTVNTSGQSLAFDIVLGIVGAVVGGALFSLVGAALVTGLDLYSPIVAVVGAIAVLWVYHAFVGRRPA